MRRPGSAILAALALATAGALGVSLERAASGGDEKRPAAHPAHGGPDFDAPLQTWREGPVRYLLTKEEDGAFRALVTDEDRAAFIQRFWVSRDPDPSTPENEYRMLFYGRVLEANRLFADSAMPGWKTDRGKIFILLGPPDDLDEESNPLDRRRSDLLPDKITWTYRSLPAGQHSEPPSIIHFHRDLTGEYRLDDDDMFFEANSRITFQTQAMQVKSLPNQKKLLDTIVAASPGSEPTPFRTHHDFFRSMDGNTLAVLTLGVKSDLLPRPPAGGPEAPAAGAESPAGLNPGPGGENSRPAPPGGLGRFEVLARLTGVSADLPSYDLAPPHGLLGDASGPLVDSKGYLLFQGAVPVRPGKYVAYYGVVDRGDGRIHSFKEGLEIPDLRDPGFMLSVITLASRVEHVDRGRTTAYSTPFVLGNLRALPRPDDVFHEGDDLAFYFQIYGPETDPIDGRPDLDVEYSFFIAHEDDAGGLKFAPLGKPILLTRQRGQVQGYTFPLKGWPPATYRLRVQVTDNLGSRHSTQEISFRVL